MPQVVFTQHIQRHVPCPPSTVAGDTVREILDTVFIQTPQAKSYILDDQGILRKHIVIFVKGRPIKDRNDLSDPVAHDEEIYIMQALSGG